jgi:hypothetical protein
MARPVCAADAAGTTPSWPKVAWRRAFVGLWRRLRAALGARGDRAEYDSDCAFKFFNGSKNTMDTTVLDKDSEEEVFTEERVVSFPKRRGSAHEQRQALLRADDAPDLRDIYSLIDAILVEQCGEADRHCASRTKAWTRSTRETYRSLHSSGTVASRSLYTNSTPLCIFDDASVDTFYSKWKEHRTMKRATKPLPKPCRRSVRSSSTHEKLVWYDVDCPWETNWAELTLRSDESVESTYLLGDGGGPGHYHGHSATAWPMPSMHTTHRPDPTPADASYTGASHVYRAWKPKWHLLEV